MARDRVSNFSYGRLGAPWRAAEAHVTIWAFHVTGVVEQGAGIPASRWV